MTYTTFTTDHTLDIIDNAHGVSLHIVKGRPDASGIVVSIEAHTTPRNVLKAYADNLKAYTADNFPEWLTYLEPNQPCSTHPQRCPDDCREQHPECLAAMLREHYGRKTPTTA